MEDSEDKRLAKRRKLNASTELATNQQPSHSLSRPISPPLPKRKSAAATPTFSDASWNFDNVPQHEEKSTPHLTVPLEHVPIAQEANYTSTSYVASPIQLSRVTDLLPPQNVDVVGLRDILGDPMIKECWNFNFLFDLDFVMSHFDEDVKDLVQVKIIHGFWKNDDSRRIALLEASEKYPNIQLLNAYIPDPFGTHHTKMLILFRHDDLAQVVIHTSNMIERDWHNMTQAVWCSPLLPFLSSAPMEQLSSPIGSGLRFRIDILRYLKAYGNRLNDLTRQLANYDFSSIRAAFIGSAPSRQKPTDVQSAKQTSYGWLGLQEILSSVPIVTNTSGNASQPHIIMQVSSIATLGAAPTWLNHLQTVLSRQSRNQGISPASLSKSNAFFAKKTVNRSQRAINTPHPKFNIIFPTPEEIRTCLDGYAAGASIHIKLQSAQQQKQLEYLHPLFCHWKHPSTPDTPATTQVQRKEALRGPAAPHIKTYIRFSDDKHEAIDWAMVTSANLSKQAWGDVVNKKDEIWIQSWEAGVVVWPALFADVDKDHGDVVMVPVFGKDIPSSDDFVEQEGSGDEEDGQGDRRHGKKVVGFRMPYDLPLSPYKADDKPWCATMQHQEPDWKGLAWGGC